MASNMMDVDVPQLERIEEQKEGSSTSNEVHQSSTQSSKSKSHKQQSHYLRKRKQFLNYLKEVPAYQLLEIDHNLADRLVSEKKKKHPKNHSILKQNLIFFWRNLQN